MKRYWKDDRYFPVYPGNAQDDVDEYYLCSEADAVIAELVEMVKGHIDSLSYAADDSSGAWRAQTRVEEKLAAILARLPKPPNPVEP